MAYDVVKFVDSIAASPTTRLDVNDGSQWTVRDFQAPPPRLRRSAVSNAMTDGAYVSSSSYDARTLFLEIDLITSTQDTGATELQKLARELDRSTNFLMYQPNALTKPVFFKTWRSDFSDVVDVRVVGAYRRLSVELLAEPFALGLRETVSVGTVNNDPAAGSNGCYFDVTGVIGDVAAPMVLVDTATLSWEMLLAVRQRGTVTDLPTVLQAESAFTLGTDTANPGGGPDAAMSGTGTNNFVRISFATTTTMASRLTWAASTTAAVQNALTGSFRVIAVVRRSGTASTMTLQLWQTGLGAIAATLGDEVTIPATTARNLVDLGLVDFGAASAARPSPSLDIRASRSVAGAETLDIDYVQLIPADAACMTVGYNDSANDFVIDGENERTYSVNDGTVLFSTGTYERRAFAVVTGGFPLLVPNQANRFFYVKYVINNGYSMVKTDTGSVTLYYHPRYLHVRPATT